MVLVIVYVNTWTLNKFFEISEVIKNDLKLKFLLGKREKQISCSSIKLSLKINFFLKLPMRFVTIFLTVIQP